MDKKAPVSSPLPIVIYYPTEEEMLNTMKRVLLLPECSFQQVDLLAWLPATLDIDNAEVIDTLTGEEAGQFFERYNGQKEKINGIMASTSPNISPDDGLFLYCICAPESIPAMKVRYRANAMSAELPAEIKTLLTENADMFYSEGDSEEDL